MKDRLHSLNCWATASNNSWYFKCFWHVFSLHLNSQTEVLPGLRAAHRWDLRDSPRWGAPPIPWCHHCPNFSTLSVQQGWSSSTCSHCPSLTSLPLQWYFFPSATGWREGADRIACLVSELGTEVLKQKWGLQLYYHHFNLKHFSKRRVAVSSPIQMPPSKLQELVRSPNQ